MFRCAKLADEYRHQQIKYLLIMRNEVRKRIQESIASDKKRRTYANVASTFMGILVAVAQAWMNIDWDQFDGSRSAWLKIAPKLVMSTVIALGGYLTSINILRPKK
jgi:hypothetical protein